MKDFHIHASFLYGVFSIIILQGIFVPSASPCYSLIYVLGFSLSKAIVIHFPLTSQIMLQLAEITKEKYTSTRRLNIALVGFTAIAYMLIGVGAEIIYLNYLLFIFAFVGIGSVFI